MYGFDVTEQTIVPWESRPVVLFQGLTFTERWFPTTSSFYRRIRRIAGRWRTSGGGVGA
jgi:hypothetical protein